MRAPAAVRADRRAHFPEHLLQCLLLGHGEAQRMKRVDAVDFERGRIEPRALEGLHVPGVRRAAPHAAAAIDLDDDRGDLQQRVGAGMEAAGLDVDDDRQVATEAPRGEVRVQRHASRQRSFSPARSGTSDIVAERVVRRNLPALASQRDAPRVQWQAVEARSEFAGEGLEAGQRTGILEHLGIEFEGGMRRVDAGAAAGVLLRRAGMRCAVGAEEEARIAAGHRIEQGQPVGLALQHRQAVVMRADAAGEQRIAVHCQVLRGHRRGDATAALRTNSTAARVVTCSNTIAQPRQPLVQRCQHLVDETGLAIEHVDLWRA